MTTSTKFASKLQSEVNTLVAAGLTKQQAAFIVSKALKAL